MHFDKEDHIAHPAPLVLATLLDRLEEVAPFLPSIECIETLEREDLADGRVRIVRRWQGADTGVPTALRPFLSRDLLAWYDTALWTPDEYKVDWSQATAAEVVADLYRCSGTNRFEPAPESPTDTTRVAIAGELEVHSDQLPGVPSFLGRSIAPQIERFIVSLITPNLTELSTGLGRYLDARG